MKPLLEKLPLEEDQSFVAKTFRTPHFEVPWHQHPELEIILFLEGEGNAFVGNHVGNFNSGDIFFLGANLPHTFQKATPGLVTAALVIQFLPDCCGKDLWEIPEGKALRNLLDNAACGLKVDPAIALALTPKLQRLEQINGFQRIIGLWDCLDFLSRYDHKSLSSKTMTGVSHKEQERLDSIFHYTIGHYAQGISLDAIAAHAGMSIPAFCHYFRKRTKKTYVEFLNEVRIGKACQQLVDTTKPITEIAFESGFNTLANFNKQFLKLKKMQPREYRNKFSDSRELAAPPQPADNWQAAGMKRYTRV
ncbi:AraC family transcriptional regulator [Flavihumibacter petaseus]|uniref:Putative AraC family transcriptional regulator n=1 Tax=Flavihumibacter petaseus NBRC 106054 TaxID=1220578 RepID=A0A0E9MWZ4_9BACT|nr:AraC family transcriptional regulator [Flavihumibacter petaseus]GAO41640.1 putative AraC family transcriptional regulator [Flavihumibacter petaseus NBRC 106054]